MNVKELIAHLSKLPDNADVLIFHDRYCGGGDSERFDDPTIFIRSDLSVVYITPSIYDDYLRGMVNPDEIMTISELDKELSQ